MKRKLNDEVKNLLIKNIAFYREKRGLTKYALADKLGVDHSYISNLESGKKGITLALLYQLSEVLGVSLDALFSDDSDSEIINNIDTMLRRLSQENLEKMERIVIFHINELENH